MAPFIGRLAIMLTEFGKITRVTEFEVELTETFRMESVADGTAGNDSHWRTITQ
jgi:hypothetical protein